MMLEEERLNFDALPERRKLFIKHYLECRNGAEAARLAGFKASNANVQAYRILSDPQIKQYIEERAEYSYDDWLAQVKNVQLTNKDNWQASIKSLELYGKAKGWLRDNQITFNQLSVTSDDISKLRKSLQRNNLQSIEHTVYPQDTNRCEQAVDSVCVEGVGVERVGEPPATPSDKHTTPNQTAQQNNEIKDS